ncbi:unnamed protein product [Notodromas monacha]|uniref:Uncharacterized protein n=1 Tax=Notodromas monacha TaxID=399045 RepID=A0A7R9BQY3_9CRUS|nr:unnamed protein product [Notodromas monacha]CAG0918977.1 unnamed protein product [Notodromas monacha]
MCGGFTCSKNALTALNILYILVAFILIFAATIGKISAYVTSETVIGGIVACGVFLLLVSIVGLIGAAKHHQSPIRCNTFLEIWVFMECFLNDWLCGEQYMVILFLLFVVQFSVAIACLAVTNKQQIELLRKTWNRAGNETHESIQQMFECCSFESLPPEGSTCEKIPACCDPGTNATDCCRSKSTCKCKTCRETLLPNLSYAYKVSGGLGLFFSFTEVFGFFVARRFRNTADPLAYTHSMY